MKSILLTCIISLLHLVAIAQSDTLTPHWEKGQFWKITSQTIAPDNESIDQKKEITYYTTNAEFLWEIVDIQDSFITFSVLPIQMSVVSDIENTLQQSQFTIDGFNLLKSKNQPLLYVVNKNGSLIKYENEDSIPRFFVNDSMLLSVFIHEYLKYENGAELLEENGGIPIEYTTITTFLYSILKNIHLPLGYQYEANTSKEITNASKDRFLLLSESYSEVMPFLTLNGFESVKTQNNNLMYHFDINMNLGNAFKQIFLMAIQDAKNKKEKKEMIKNYQQMEKLKINVDINGSFEYVEKNKFPKKYTTIIKFDGNHENETIKFKSTNILTFE